MREYPRSITEEINFGIDPLQNIEGFLNEWETKFHQNYQVDEMYNEMVNNRPGRFKTVIMYYLRQSVGALFYLENKVCSVLPNC